MSRGNASSRSTMSRREYSTAARDLCKPEAAQLGEASRGEGAFRRSLTAALARPRIRFAQAINRPRAAMAETTSALRLRAWPDCWVD